MASPNMATITASLERSLQNCSLNHHQHGGSRSSSTTTGGTANGSDSPVAALELNSESSLPFHWEQCLDLKRGEIYYINWRTGMKASEDPRTTGGYGGGDYYSEEDDSNESSFYDDSEGSSSESSPSSSRDHQWSGNNNNNEEEEEENYYYYEEEKNEKENVLVVGGCKSCLMYYMVPKQLQICPKCCGQLLHFDRSQNASS